MVLTGAANKDLHVSGDVVAFSSSTPPASSWWDSLPIATDVVLGGIKVGANLTIDPDGTLNAVADGDAAA